MKKIKTCPNHLESVFIPLIQKISQMSNRYNPRHYECIEAYVQMLEHHRKDIISVNEDAVEFKKDNGSIHRFHIRSYNLMEQTITNFQNGDLSLNRDTACKGSLLDSRKAERKGVGFELFISFVLSHLR